MMTRTRINKMSFMAGTLLVLAGLILFIQFRRYIPVLKINASVPFMKDGSTSPNSIAPTQRPARTLTPKPIIGVGVMGDSNSDEYRAEDSRGGKKHPALNWVEQLALSRDINFGPWGTWGEPRRTGYKYNWARSSATTRRMITSGQHTGLAKQVAAGEVSHVVIYIGGADFHLERGTYEEIYNGSLRGRALQTKIDTIIAELTLAVDTLQDAGDVRIVIVSYIDKGLAPETLRRFPNPIGRSRVSKAVQAVNDGIAAMAEKRQGVAVADMNEYGKTVLSRLTITGHLDVGGEQISVLERGHEPHHMQLADRSGHFGTVASGLLANVILVEPFNRAFGLNIEPLSDLEILQNAGLR